jgi:catechol 2,3-dioxygenase-like lactoylglutathione lyase family enzyme
MQFNHIHVKVRDLPAAIAWMRDVWNVKPDFENDRMASLPLGSFWLFLDCAAEDTMATVGFGTDDCTGTIRHWRREAPRGSKNLRTGGGGHELPISKGRDDCDSSSSRPLLKQQPKNGTRRRRNRPAKRS